MTTWGYSLITTSSVSPPFHNGSTGLLLSLYSLLSDNMTKPTIQYLFGGAERYFKGPTKQFKVQRVGLRTDKEPYYVIKNLRDPSAGVARVPEKVFLEWQQKLTDSRNPQRAFKSLYKYTEIGNLEYRMNMYQNFLTLVNFSSDISEENRARLEELLKNLDIDQWEKLTRKKPELFEEIWDKYDYYSQEAVETGSKRKTLKDKDFEKLIEELERIVK